MTKLSQGLLLGTCTTLYGVASDLSFLGNEWNGLNKRMIELLADSVWQEKNCKWGTVQWMKEFHVPCTRKQGREGVTVHSCYGVVHSLMHVGEYGAFAGFQQKKLLASEYQCPEEQRQNTQGLYGLLYCSYLPGVGERVVTGFSRWSNLWGGPGICFISKCW